MQQIVVLGYIPLLVNLSQKNEDCTQSVVALLVPFCLLDEDFGGIFNN